MSRQNRRIRRHALLACIALLLVSLLFFAFDLSQETWHAPPTRKADSPLWRLSMATAYSALTFLAVTLSIGPLNLLRGRSNPVNTMMRRDVGIWAGGLALLHMSVGALIHTESLQLWWLFFNELPSTTNPLPIRMSKMGLANYLGLFQATLLVVLLLLSNNRALRKLGTRRWKNAQRLAYIAFGSVAAHGFLYQWAEGRDGRITTIFFTIIIGVVIVQLLGVRHYRQKNAVLRAKSSNQVSWEK